MSTPDPALQLKSAPPRAARGFLERERLKLARLEWGGSHVTAAIAPTGFGKTSQLACWRREALERGAVAIWQTLDNRDEPVRFVRGLAQSAQAACGKLGFGEGFMRWLDECSDAQEAMTGWLAQVAQLAVETVLLLDEVDLLPESTRTGLLPYLLGNAPANLHIALAARPAGALLSRGMLDIVQVTRVTAAELRFSLDDTLAVLSAALGTRCNPEAGVHLHELTEGWPLGVQLAVAALHRSGELEGLLAAATADMRRYFLDRLIARQSDDAIQLLVRLAQFDLIHPSMCAEVLDRPGAAGELLRLQEETPLLVRAEASDWMRLHPMAREALGERLEQLSNAERQVMSKKASAWYAAEGLYEEAAQQSFLAGDISRAIDLVERNTHQMTVQGRSAPVLDWFERLTAEEVSQHPGFWAPAAWAYAMGDRHAQAQPLITRILAQPELSVAEQFEAELIAATAAAFADRVDVLERHVQAWPMPPPSARPEDVPIHFVAKAFVSLYRGEPDQARRELARIAAFDRKQAYSPVSYGFADYGVGVCHLWEGRYVLAAEALRPALARAEERMNRRNPVACMLAAVLAQACWESGTADDPAALLAGRMNLLDRHGLPDALISAYTVLSRLADHEGRQDQALDLLESMGAVGRSRGLLRLQVAAQREIVRLHARRGRADTALALAGEADALVRRQGALEAGAFSPWLELQVELARAFALSAHQDVSNQALAARAIEKAAALSTRLKRGADFVTTRLLQVQLLRRQGAAEMRSVLQESISLAKASGMGRLLHDHGIRELDQPDENSLPSGELAARPVATAPRSLVRGTGLLTDKERAVLALLSRNLSNKEIALAMGIGEQTIKWHVKNLFQKLNASNRKHVVARARMLGLVDS